MYAQRKNMPIEEIEVAVDRDDSEERQGVYRLEGALRITGDLTRRSAPSCCGWRASARSIGS